MNLEPLQDGWSRAIRAVFGGSIGIVVAAAVWAIEPAGEFPSFAILAAGLSLVIALGTAFFGHAFWRAVAGNIDG